MSSGDGFGLLVRSLLTSLVEQHHIGTLYQIISVCGQLGLLVAGPILSTAFSFGLKLGGFWTGLPYIVAGCMFGTATIIVFTLRLPASSVV